MDRSTYIKHFIRVAEGHLEKMLPEEATEGQFIFSTFTSLGRMLKHVKVQTEKGEDDA